jgi:hypothetical protein
MDTPHTTTVAFHEGEWLHNLPRVDEKTRVLVLSLRDSDGRLSHPNAVKDPQKAAGLAGIRLELGGLRARALSSQADELGSFYADENADALHRLGEAWGLDEAWVRGLFRTHGQDELVPLDFAGLCTLVRQSLESRPVESGELVSRAALDGWRSTLPTWGPRTAHLEQVERGLTYLEALLSWDTTRNPVRYLVVELAEEFVTVRQGSYAAACPLRRGAP